MSTCKYNLRSQKASNNTNIEPTTTFNVAEKCIDCNDFYASNGIKRCTQCAQEYPYPHLKQAKLEQAEKERKLDLSQIDLQSINKISLRDVREQAIQFNLSKLFTVWQQGLTIAPVPRVNGEIENDTLIESLKASSSAQQVYFILNGKSNYSTIKNVHSLVKATDADYLLAYWEGRDKQLHSSYIHVLCPHVYDVWNMRCDESVFLCYYQEYGALRVIPNTTSKLFELWNRVSRNMYRQFVFQC